LENIGIKRGLDRAQSADVRVHLSVDGAFEKASFDTGLDLFIRSKADILDVSGPDWVSAKTGLGIPELLGRIQKHLETQVASAGVATRRRHESSLRAADVALQRFIDGLASDILPVDLLSDELQQAIRALDSLIGRIDVENVLDEIFSSFCIGK